MALQVNAPLVTAVTENDRVVYLSRGDVVPKGVTKESLEHLKSLGFVTGDDVDPTNVLPGDDEERAQAARKSSK